MERKQFKIFRNLRRKILKFLFFFLIKNFLLVGESDEEGLL